VTAGYSGTPLPRKLGLPAAGRAAVLGAPSEYLELLAPWPAALALRSRLSRPMNFIQLFAPDRRSLARRLPAAVRTLAVDGTLWLCWPKKTSGRQTDLDEAGVRRAGLDAGLVDVKICAVDDTWSGLKFVRRLEDRRRSHPP
jgi:hypothetical protein